jgi:cytosine/adenosine deaminase-related metal-dependent hydrolase
MTGSLMKRFSSQYIITNSGPLLKRAVIITEDDGTIVNIEETGGKLKESHSVEFHNGVIIPGFVNCHCHLELSHMKGSVKPGTGLGDFIQSIRTTRSGSAEEILQSAYSADREMNNEGIVLCADVCNTPVTFKLKKKSHIEYINLLEVFGIDSEKAVHRFDEIIKVADAARDTGLAFNMVPHSVYSMSLSLFRLLLEKSEDNTITSIHFMENIGEKSFLENHTGSIIDSYQQSGLLPLKLETVRSHTDALLNQITPHGNLILVHNTYVDRATIGEVRKRKNLFWCLCPKSNIFIENHLPPLPLLLEEDCEIVIGTDSLASNNRLSILDELKSLQLNFPSVSLEELVKWATINGAKSLGEADRFGKIESGKKPGLLLLRNVDLINMKLLPDSFVTRLI